MKDRLVVIVLGMALVVALGAMGMAEEKEKKSAKVPEYVGQKKCKICHKDVHASWLKTKHAEALGSLSEEDQKKDSCLVCHVTGHGVAEELHEGVQCEACHGPGSLYKSPKIMSKKKYKADPEAQRALAIEAGLLMPDEETCVGCHNKKSPTFKGFDYEKMKAKGIHILTTVEPKEAKKDTTTG
jgi:hypothetical protein